MDTLEENSKILFYGSGIVKVLGYANTPNSLKKHCKYNGIAKYDSVDNL